MHEVNSMHRAVPCGVVTSISCRICGLHGEHVVSYLVWPASGFRLLWAFTFLKKVYVLVQCVDGSAAATRPVPDGLISGLTTCSCRFG